MIEANLLNPPTGTKLSRLLRPPEVPPAGPRTGGILVVDDEAGVRGLLNVVMRQRGFTVWLAGSGQEALEVYRRQREFIDVVLLDVRMPGLDGPQTLAALRAVNPQLRCCFMTGDPGVYQPSDLLAHGARHVFSKPFQMDEIIRVVRRLAHETMERGPEVLQPGQLTSLFPTHCPPALTKE